MSVELSPDELRRVTRKKHVDAQERVLKALGIPYVPHPDGGLLVARRAVENRLLERPGKPRDDAVPQVDVAAIRGFRHGKARR